MGERLAGQPTTFFEREALSVFDARSYQCVIVRIGDDGHSGAVLGRTANHGRTTDVDLLDGGSLIRARTNRIGEWIQVDDHQIERLDAVTFPAVPRGPHWSCQRECPRGYAGRGF